MVEVVAIPRIGSEATNISAWNYLIEAVDDRGEIGIIDTSGVVPAEWIAEAIESGDDRYFFLPFMIPVFGVDFGKLSPDRSVTIEKVGYARYPNLRDSFLSNLQQLTKKKENIRALVLLGYWIGNGGYVLNEEAHLNITGFLNERTTRNTLDYLNTEERLGIRIAPPPIEIEEINLQTRKIEWCAAPAGLALPMYSSIESREPRWLKSTSNSSKRTAWTKLYSSEAQQPRIQVWSAPIAFL